MAPRRTQIVWAALAVGLGTAAGVFHPLLDRYEISPPLTSERYPELALLSVMPGGLRAPIVNYLWISASNHAQKGEYHDAGQLASLICHLMPRFPGVWVFQSWNLAWNVSVSTHTDQERWHWVSEGMRLLRDEGIPLNPNALELYQQLGWIFSSKMGDNVDEKHRVYKQRWAAEMQRLLGAPPTGQTAEAIAAFRPIAEAPLDKNLAPDDRGRIQPGPLKALLADPAVKAYADLMGAHEVRIAGQTHPVKIDQTLLEAYNRYSLEPGAASVRSFVGPPALRDNREKELFNLINSTQHAPARAKMLAFVRAQVLWNVYKMDPQWMLGMMEQYNAPLDWRLVWPHGLYWVTYGIHVCKSISLGTVTALNTDRIVLNCLRMLTWNGRLTYIENPQKPESPMILMMPDWRYIEPTHKEHIRFGQAVQAYKSDLIAGNVFRDGHINYLVDAIGILVTLGRVQEADEWLNWIRQNYKVSGGRWDIPSSVDFIRETYNSEGSPSAAVAAGQFSAAMQSGVHRFITGDVRGYRESMAYAKFVHWAYNKDAPARIQLPPPDEYAASILVGILVEPGSWGYDIPLDDRSRLYKAAADLLTRKRDGTEFSIQAMVYNWIAEPLREQCKAANLPFDTAFPKPPDLDAYRAWLKRQSTPAPPPPPGTP